jgi:hypothetical protein
MIEAAVYPEEDLVDDGNDIRRERIGSHFISHDIEHE